MTLTDALAHSNNLYFETVGRRLGFERVRHYANQFGLGELAGWNITGEQLGVYPNQELPEKLGGVGRMCSFGEKRLHDPATVGRADRSDCQWWHALLPAAPDYGSRGGQLSAPRQAHPGHQAIHPGGCARHGRSRSPTETARSLRASFNELPVLGKTGTCSADGTRYGWFTSFADTSYGRIVTVFFLEGGRPTFGPKAAELTGVFYRNLWDHSYFAAKNPADAPAAGVLGQPNTATGVTQ